LRVIIDKLKSASMTGYKSPDKFIEETPKFPTSVVSVKTAIPAFIGYTEKAQRDEPGDLLNIPLRITSLKEYERFFGFPKPETGISVNIIASATALDAKAEIDFPSRFILYYSLQLFFNNGGGPCYIVSVGNYNNTGTIDRAALEKGLSETAKTDEVTLLLFPDASNLAAATDYYALHKKAMEQCRELKDRFVLMDIFMNPALPDKMDVEIARELITGNTDELKYAAVYYPRIYTRLPYYYKTPGTGNDNDEWVQVTGDGVFSFNGTLKELKKNYINYYSAAKDAIRNLELLLPASPAVAGIYAKVDKTYGVWKAPANICISNAVCPEILISSNDQADLNVDSSGGKSINAIRTFEGIGPAIIWGARTLAGNDNVWRYISVRRFFNMIEESLKKATAQFVFEPNDQNTWIGIKSMIENYLMEQWRSGALQGPKPQEAFFVRVGLNETMTQLDLLEGRLIVEIGMAAARPAEFVIIRFIRKMRTET
jgi:uncharacterized protein